MAAAEQAAPATQAEIQSRQALSSEADVAAVPEPVVVQITTVSSETPAPEDLPASVAAEVAAAQEAVLEEAAATSSLAADLPGPAAPLNQDGVAAPLAEPQRAAPAGAVHSEDPSLKSFLENWSAFTASLAAQGCFKDEQFDMASTDVEMYGVIKRAVLSLARERPDIIHSLPEQKLVLLIKQELPYVERKITNAKERLNASYLAKESLPVGVGGVASTQDLARLIIGAYYSIRQARKSEQITEAPPKLHQAAFLDAVTSLIPDILQLMASPPDPAALAKADAVTKTKESMAFTTPGTRQSYAGRGRDREGSAGAPPGRLMSRQDSRFELKPGDWVCEVCKQHNFASRHECYRCSAEKPGTSDEDLSMLRQRVAPPPVVGMGQDSGMRPGDWTCPECQNVNFARRMACNRCDMPRPAETMPKGGFSTPAFEDSRFTSRRTDFAAQGVKQGDWFCPECNAHNFASRRECFQCNEVRPASAGGRRPANPLPYDDRRYDNRRTDMAPAGARQGDWFCGDCGAHNFASRTQCFQCDSPKASGRSATGGRPSFDDRSSRGPSRNSFERFQRIEPASGDDWFNKG